MTMNTSAQLASSLIGRTGKRVALTDVAVSAVLRELLAEVTVTQTYRNTEAVNIEAVYTFPLPPDAVLLELEVEIGGRRLQGTVIERKAAERSYEDAVSAGDAAVMLELAENGLYTMNVGNLLPGETAKVAFKYALLYRWSGDRLRLHLPTTVAPRYGRSPLRPHQVPEASLTVENRFSLQIEIHGALREAQFSCPTHAVSLVQSAKKSVISFVQERAVMDRDFVLNVKAARAARSFVLCGQDVDGMAALASFQPFFGGLQQPRALDLAVVVDCSGSMAGVSMQQAKQALEGIIDLLQPQDSLTLVAFGSSAQALRHRPLRCTAGNLGQARTFAAALDANMGGTEIGNALAQSYAIMDSDIRGDILLITDGQVGDWFPTVDAARYAGHRIFTVGVGSAVSAAFLRGLADATGGTCELVSPREGMAERIVRHFERMRASRAKRVSVRWPTDALDTTPRRIGAVFEGDTIVASARFQRLPAEASAELDVETEAGDTVRQALSIPAMVDASDASALSTVARLTAAERMKLQDADAARATALRYRLLSPWTNWLVVAVRADNEKAQDLPELRKVPQTLAAGWGGTGDIGYMDGAGIMADRSASIDSSQSFGAMFARMEMNTRSSALYDREFLLADMMSLPATPDWQKEQQRLLELIGTDASKLDLPNIVELLEDAGYWQHFTSLILFAARKEMHARTVAAILLEHLLAGERGTGLSAQARAAYDILRRHAQSAYASIRDAALKIHITRARAMIEQRLPGAASACG